MVSLPRGVGVLGVWLSTPRAISQACAAGCGGGGDGCLSWEVECAKLERARGTERSWGNGSFVEVREGVD